jgi:hypothetical protein
VAGGLVWTAVVAASDWEDEMQADKAERLREAWAKKGNPSCDHPRLDKEYILGGDTGDVVCTTCGAINPQRPSRKADE